MIKCNRTGATLLYGTRCAGCDCERSRRPHGFHEGGFVPTGQPAPIFRGVDEAKGGDSGATAKVRIGRDYKYTIEDIEYARHPDLDRLAAQQAEILRRQTERMNEEIIRGVWGNSKPSGRARSQPRQEIITDPKDSRGIDARPARRADHG